MMAEDRNRAPCVALTTVRNQEGPLPMPRFFFDITDDETTVDDVGKELEGLNAARLEAVRLSGELLQSWPDRFWDLGQWSCSVRDDTGLVLFVLHFFATEAPAVTGATFRTTLMGSSED